MNDKPKLCKDCKHSIETREHLRCLHPSVVSNDTVALTAPSVYELGLGAKCSDERVFNLLFSKIQPCSLSGKLWETKDDN